MCFQPLSVALRLWAPPLCFCPPSSRGQLERSWTCGTTDCTSGRRMTCSDSLASLGPRSHFPNFHRTTGRLKGFVSGREASASHKRDRRQKWASGGRQSCSFAIRRVFNGVFKLKVFKAQLPTPQDVVWPRLWVFNGGCKRRDTGDCLAENPPACDSSYCEQLKSSLPGLADSEAASGVRVTTGVRFTSHVYASFFHIAHTLFVSHGTCNVHICTS